MISYEIPSDLSGLTYNGKPLLWTALVCQKQHRSLSLAGLHSSQTQLEEFKSKWASGRLKLKMGKFCIRFRCVDELETELIADVIQSKSPAQALEIIRSARGQRSSSIRSVSDHVGNIDCCTDTTCHASFQL